ncbi:uncharacterized protein LOC141679873 [Apium graveolens]|uniref:uncharacterized protein LOC141679873 n=1 Tax=Apium graveolens TaxID=4045 RepID=UPI003D792958
MPIIKSYDGIGDPANHVMTFSNALLLQPVNDVVKCRAFPQTLTGMAQRWYRRLPLNSIGSFKDLSRAFIKQFISGRVHEKIFASLMSIVQVIKKSLRDYMNHLTKEALKVQDLGDKEKYPRVEKDVNSTPKKGGPGQKLTEYARLNAPRSQILMEIEKYRDVRWPKPLKADLAKLNKRKYCRFHKDAGHDTDECQQLKDEIEFLIRKGRLSKYTGYGEKGQRNNNGRRNFDDRRRDQDDQG